MLEFMKQVEQSWTKWITDVLMNLRQHNGG